MQNSRELADAYIDSVLARVHYKTGGSYKAYEVLPDGTRQLFDDVAGEYRINVSICKFSTVLHFKLLIFTYII